MNGYHIEKLPGEPIILHIFHDNWSVGRDLANAISEAAALLDSAGGPVYFISDLSLDPPFNLNDLIAGTNQVARGANTILHHPNLKKYLVVTQNRVHKFAMNGLRAEVFGAVPTVVFDTLDEALEYARSQAR